MKLYVWIFASIIGAGACFYFSVSIGAEAEELRAANTFDAVQKRLYGDENPLPYLDKSKFGGDPRLALQTERGREIIHSANNANARARVFLGVSVIFRYTGFFLLVVLLSIETYVSAIALRGRIPPSTQNQEVAREPTLDP